MWLANKYFNMINTCCFKSEREEDGLLVEDEENGTGTDQVSVSTAKDFVRSNKGNSSSPVRLFLALGAAILIGGCAMVVLLRSRGCHLVSKCQEASGFKETSGISVQVSEKGYCDSAGCHEAAVELLSYMDANYQPCDDFYQYACGRWSQTHKPGPTEESIDALGELSKQNTIVIRDILEKLSIMDGAAEKAKSFYQSCMNKTEDPLAIEEDSEWRLVYNTSESGSTPTHEDDSDSDTWDPDTDSSWRQLGHNEKVNKNDKYSQATDDQKGPLSIACAAHTQKLFPDITSRLFVTAKMSQSSLLKIKSMLEEVRQMLIDKVFKLSWLDLHTKWSVRSSLAKTLGTAGYPDFLLDVNLEKETYQDVTISKEGKDYKANVDTLKLMIVWDDVRLAYISDANAFYSYLTDELFIPSGIAQKPFFSEDYPDIINYAKFATTISHEFTHALEEYLGKRGIPKSPNGISAFSSANFDKRTQCLRDQYSHFNLTGTTVKMNGGWTWNEDLADVVGLQVAFEIFQKTYRGRYLPLPGLKELTPEQIFFIGAAQVDCRSFASSYARESVLEMSILFDTHSPNSIRVLGEMSNNNEFSKAFKCPIGSKYNPVKKCQIFD